MTPEAIASIAASVQPLVFETEIEDARYGTSGTAFIVTFERRVFVLTARHALKPEARTRTGIFATDSSRKFLPIRDAFFLPQETFDEDYADFAILEVDLTLVDYEMAMTSAIDLGLAVGDWYGTRERSKFFVVGFPLSHVYVNYEREAVSTQRVALSGRFAGSSYSAGTYQLDMTGCGLTTFNGFSGAPVFSWLAHIARPAQIMLAGMVIRGTIESGRMHFLGVDVLLAALRTRCRLA
jgi:hypothetical protein